jgi:hypothetical protein
LGRGDKSAAFFYRHLAKLPSALVRAVRTFFYNFLRLCVCARSEPSGPEQASIELQVVILEWLGTAAKLAVHLAQVSQVDQVHVFSAATSDAKGDLKG